MPGAHATAGHRLHVERITLREIRLPLWIHLSCSFSGWQRLSDKLLSSKRRPNKALQLTAR
jgi:hypothetical protein